jgi:hypothetical protein
VDERPVLSYLPNFAVSQRERASGCNGRLSEPLRLADGEPVILTPDQRSRAASSIPYG